MSSDADAHEISDTLTRALVQSLENTAELPDTLALSDILSEMLAQSSDSEDSAARDDAALNAALGDEATVDIVEALLDTVSEADVNEILQQIVAQDASVFDVLNPATVLRSRQRSVFPLENGATDVAKLIRRRLFE